MTTTIIVYPHLFDTIKRRFTRKHVPDFSAAPSGNQSLHWKKHPFTDAFPISSPVSRVFFQPAGAVAAGSGGGRGARQTTLRDPCP